MELEHIIAILQSGALDKFYKCKEWLTKREEALKRDNDECQRCKTYGGYSKAQCVHHIVFLKTNPRLALTLTNLVSLCNSCHNFYHPEKAFRGAKRKSIIKEKFPEQW